jgi:hypothetical protein
MIDPEEPTKQYYYALCGEATAIFKEYLKIKMGMKVYSKDQKERWNERKDFVLSEIRRVRKLL